MSRSHVLVVPYPAQGHVNPLMDLSHELAKHDIKITFVNTDFIHKKIIEAEARCEGKERVRSDQIQLVSIPDGLEQDENRNHHDILLESIRKVMPKKLERLIQEINEESESEKISCVVADGTIGWALEVAEKMGIRQAVLFWPASASFLALFLSLPKLLHDGIIDTDGTPAKDQIIHLAPDMPVMRTTHFLWTTICDNLNAQKTIFDFVLRDNKFLQNLDWVICNSTDEFEAPAFAFAPKILPIGPLRARKSNHTDHLERLSFWPEDSTCLNWLDLQQNKSVIYVAFGSLATSHHTQLQELALGLELSNKPFLWVVRSDISNGESHDFLKEFEGRLCCRGKVVNWAPQQKVLSHPSIACFLSHCGWNSTIEGVINGVPFLCWPFFSDQFIDETYICDIWKVGLSLDRNDGIVSREDIAFKIKQVLSDQGFKVRALQLKERAVNSVKESGSSYKNLKNFVDWIKA